MTEHVNCTIYAFGYAIEDDMGVLCCLCIYLSVDLTIFGGIEAGITMNFSVTRYHYEYISKQIRNVI